LDIGDPSTIDRQTDDDFSSKVCSSLHDQVSAFVGSARLGLSAADEECASESKNQKDLAGEVMF
jgi:hypothetical protein